MKKAQTPMMMQYLEIKNQHPDEILFFRLGDFYEMFFDDALLASQELEITLTSREGGNGTRVPMCGVPYHAAENYIARLVQKGYKIAICEQTEDPKAVKGIVKREVIKIISPGTVLSDSMLTDSGNNYLVVIVGSTGKIAVAASDVSTGECLWSIYEGAGALTDLHNQLYRFMPSEVISLGEWVGNEDVERYLKQRSKQCLFTVKERADSDLSALRERFGEDEWPQDENACIAIDTLLAYLKDNIKTDIAHMNRLTHLDASEYLILDTFTLRNLEVTRNMKDGGKKETLYGALDHTKTAMGKRMLKKWLEYPLMNRVRIIERQDAIEELLTAPILRENLLDALKQIYDFERILTRIEVGSANARDLLALKVSLASLPTVQAILADSNVPLLKRLYRQLETHADITALLERAIHEEPPISLRDGGMIKEGYCQELDELRIIARDSKAWISEFEQRQKEETGIKSLKVGYNKVFGYYIEVTHSNSASVPVTYVRKQTLANAERYIIPELKDFENKILGAHEKIVSLEYHLFTELRETIKQRIVSMQKSAEVVAVLDTIASLTEVAERYGYKRPDIVTTGEITIRDGRHPVIERLLKDELFVPNDAELNHTDNEIMVITGPNMAGKSTYMRQTALLILMAQMGSFIPARQAAITPVDRIFTRVGASDDLSTGQSTFMMEMNEVAQILKHATKHSFIILDEIGRGTSTFDGMSIARAVIEYIHHKIKACTMFATHYHELTDLADAYPTIRNYSIAVKERGSDVVFLRRIVAGGTDKSYGIHVAKLAGLPKAVIENAQNILERLEKEKGAPLAVAAPKEESMQISMFASPIVDDLLKIDIHAITPIEALNELYKLQKQAQRG